MDLVGALRAMDSDEAFSYLAGVSARVDWAALPGRMELADGSRVRFEKKRRSVVIDHVSGGTTVFDLGRPDRMRDRDEILTPGLVREDGPSLQVSNKFDWDADLGELALRDPLSPKLKRATNFSKVGPRPTYRFVDGDGTPQLYAVGDLADATGFCTFLMDGGAGYAHLRTPSGLGCFYDSPRAGFMKAVTGEVVEQARAEGFAAVRTGLGEIGVVFDCGAPGDYLALATYGGPHGGTVGVVVDLRRPPVRDGAIVDP